MGRIVQWLRNWLPRRRLRCWRYVSPRRRGAGVVVLLVLVSGAYLYWTQTNDGQIRKQAQTYLALLTGGAPRVQEAQFSLFGGITLRGVQVFVPGEEEPFFSAKVVVLRHRPLGLFLKRQLDVTGINCLDAVLNLSQDVRTGRWNYEKLQLPGELEELVSSEEPLQSWPPLVVRKARVSICKDDAGFRVRRGQPSLNISGMALADPWYQFTLEDVDDKGRVRIFSSVRFNRLTSRIIHSGPVDLALLDEGLYDVLGHLKAMGLSGLALVEGNWDARKGTGSLTLALRDAELRLPAELGGLHLHSLRGTLGLDANGLTADGLSGRITEAGDAPFSLSGRYGNAPLRLDANSPFDLRLRVQGLQVPQRLEAAGGLAEFLEYFHANYEAQGRLDLELSLRRGADGKVSLVGTAEADGVTFKDKSFPYPIRNLRGEVFFTDRWMDIRRLTGSHGPAQIEVDGLVQYPPEGKTYQIAITARGLPLDEELCAALSPGEAAVYRSLRPRGTVSAQAQVSVDQPGQPPRTVVDLALGGGASIEYESFPYRLEGMFGEVRLDSAGARINSVTSKHGQVSCTLDGHIRWREDANETVDLSIVARMPLDGKLARALGPAGESAFRALRPTGMADRIRGRVWRRVGEDLRYTISAQVADASFRFDEFPYQLADANGLLVFEPNRVTIRGLNGRHKDTPVSLSGTVFHGGQQVGVELQVEAPDVRLDDELFQAVPEPVQRAWRGLAAGGLADVSFFLSWRTPTDPNGLDYLCEVRAKDVTLKYAGFPYLFRGLAGKAVVTPGRVEFHDVTVREGPMKAVLGGLITLGPKEDRAELTVRASDVPISPELLAALPGRGAVIFSRVRPGGSCSVDISKLVLAGASEPPATAPATRPAATMQAATAQAPTVTQWLVEGRVSLSGAEIDLGVPAKVSGGVAGWASSGPHGFGIDANVTLEDLRVGQRVLTGLRGRVVKDPRSDTTRLEDLLGKAYGGRLSGFAEFRATDPVQYGFRVFAENMDLNELFNAAVKDPNDRVPVEGLLDATIEYRATGGPQPTRQATGMLRLSRAKVQRLPVLLNLLQPIFLSLPGETAFTEGAVDYTLSGDKLSFREIHLRGSGLTIVGSGTMDMKNETLKLTFLGRPGLLPRLDNLGDELLEGILRELVEIQVTGTPAKPRFRTIPLRSLEAIIQKLTRPE